MPIVKLPDEVASQIAAGEVVERPASVVKELMENSLDAASQNIKIIVEQAGRKVIEVADDGDGIPSSEIVLALERHATSKVHTTEDLFHINTLGFRGEALASIASVSRMTVISRTASEDTGAKILVDGGKVISFDRIGSPKGTTVRVESLFYNVPARLKFLKSERSERSLIAEFITKYALAYPEVRFTYVMDGKEKFRTSGNGDQREVLAALLGVDIAKKMLPVSGGDGSIQVNGFVSPIDVTKSNRRSIHIFVNRRPIQDVGLATAVINAYHTMIMVGRYPMAVIFVDLPPEDVDVNVHPTKAEIRLKEKDKVFREVGRAVRKSLLAFTPVPGVSLSFGQKDTHNIPRSPGENGMGIRNESYLDEASKDVGIQGAQTAQPRLGNVGDESKQGEFDQLHPRILRLIGQVASSYLVAEGPDGLYLIDQHAAHERVLFEKLTKQKSNKLAIQKLLEPVVIEFSHQESELIQDQLPILRGLGFELEEFGRNTYLIRAIPVILSNIDIKQAIRSLVEDFEEDESGLDGYVEERLIARICKKAAVKAGQPLTKEEQERLLKDLESCQSPRTCPHGRPTMIHLSVNLLERQFGRKGAR